MERTERPKAYMAGAQAAATWLTKHGGEELPHVRGQGQQPRVPGCIRAGAARGATLRLRSVAVGRRYPATEPSGGREETLRVRDQGQPGEAISHRRPGAVTLRSQLEARGQGQQLGGATHAQGQGQRPGGATPGVVAVQAQEGLEELSHVEGQER